MPDSTITASILIVTRNNPRTLSQSVSSSLAQDFPEMEYEVIVYDDGSDGPQRDLLCRLQEEHASRVANGTLRVIQGERCGGIGRGRNAAAEAARGRYLFYLDGDAYPDPGWIRATLPGFAEEMVGVSASCVVLHRCRSMINGVGASLNWFATGLDHYLFQPVEEAPRLAQYVLYAMGCGLVTSRACWEAVGGFDRAIRNYYDDADYGIRAWTHGYKVVTCPTARVFHDNSSLANASATNIFLNDVGRWRVMLKHWPVSMLLRASVYQAHLLRRVLPFSRWVSLGRALLCLLGEAPGLLRYRWSSDANAPHAFFRWLDSRFAFTFSQLAFDSRLLSGEDPLQPFREAVPAERRHFHSLGAIVCAKPQTFINHGRLTCALFPETATLSIDYEDARAGVQVFARFEGGSDEAERQVALPAAQGRLQLAVPPGSGRCHLQVRASAGVPGRPLFPCGVIALVRAYQT
ncbi:MAG: glycosyltransferase family 2 protein [Lentisphaerae bacterium]|nr:glycosyltransferase family 2 protein [Lentisphaerota bacterium]